jgi:hypothetical protein
MFRSSSKMAVVIASHFRISSSHFRTGQRCLSTWCCTFYMQHMPCTLRRNIIANAEERGFVRGTPHSRIPFWTDDASFCSVYENNTESLLLYCVTFLFFLTTENDWPKLEKWHFWLVNEKENGRNPVGVSLPCVPCLLILYWDCGKLCVLCVCVLPCEVEMLAQ